MFTMVQQLLLFKQRALWYIAFVITGLLFFSVTLSYFFQELVFHNHCITKLGIILSGNLFFWAASWPLIVAFASKTSASRYFVPASFGAGALFLYINQVLIQEFIYVIFLYGFGCLEGISNSCYMLFENNILTSGIIYCILTFLAYKKAIDKKQPMPLILDNISSAETVESNQLPAFKSHFSIKNNGTSVKVNVQHIRYIEARKNTLFIFTNDKKYVLYQSMVSVEKELDPEWFVKIHRAFIVNKSFIHSYSSIGNGNILVKLSCGTELIMTRHYKTRVDF